jgi:ABC-2 type transport system ATP-binding protein
VHASPEQLVAQVEGRVWEWLVSSAELNAARQRYLISSTTRRGDGVHVRVLGDDPPSGAAPAVPTLEDAYLFCLTQHRQPLAAEVRA